MLNHIVIMGRLVKDPELRSTGSGVSVTGFTVAVDRDYSGRDGGEKQTDFIDCTAWRQTAEFISKYFHKGSMIVVSGRLQSRKWEDKEGNKRVNWEIMADNVYFGDSKNSASRDESGNSGYEAPRGGFSRDSFASARNQASAGGFREFEDAPDEDGLPF